MKNLQKNLQNSKDKFTEFTRWSKLDIVLNNIKKFSMIYLILVLCIYFYFDTKGQILQPNQFLNLIKNNAIVIILSFGMLLVIISGNIDLSVGTLTGFLAIISVQVLNATKSVPLTFLALLLIGALVGLVQGFLVGYFKIPAFIVTLAAFLIFQGSQLALTNGTTILISPELQDSLNAWVIQSFPDVKVNGIYVVSLLIFISLAVLIVLMRVLGYLAKKRTGLKTTNIYSFIISQIIIFSLIIAMGILVSISDYGLQMFLFYILIFTAIFVFLTQNTVFGRSVYAIGGNKKSAQLSGISIKLNTTIIFIIIGALAGFAGVVLSAINGAGLVGQGNDTALAVISSVFVGGASVSGGLGTVSGTLMGAGLIGIITQWMLINNFPAANQAIAKGIILLLAVSWDIFNNRKKMR